MKPSANVKRPFGQKEIIFTNHVLGRMVSGNPIHSGFPSNRRILQKKCENPTVYRPFLFSVFTALTAKIHKAQRLDTAQQYARAFNQCREIFRSKVRDYGCSWRVLRPSSLTDQLYIKAQRIRTLEQSAVRLVDEGIEGEFQAIVNYAVIAGIQLQRGWKDERDLSEKEALSLYDAEQSQIQALMEAKNHDYGEAWRDMRVSSFTDMILVKLLRVKQI